MSFYKCYKPHRFNAKASATLDQAKIIVDKFAKRGLKLTLRQLYYQFVAASLIPNTERDYKRLGRIITNGRESGELDWLMIEDRGRAAYGPSSCEKTSEVLDGIERRIKFDQWARQETYLEVWVEKSALEGVVAAPCNERDVTYMACKGYLSASEVWRAGLRFQKAIKRGKKPVLIHLADHDPSGIHMTVDNRQRVRLFAESRDIEVRRIALNMDQIEQYSPPPNPAKQSDSRYIRYSKAHGEQSWELDALDPEVLHKLILDTIDEYRDKEIWDRVLRYQKEARRELKTLGLEWHNVRELLTEKRLDFLRYF